jgi:hypothetical protein
MFVIAGVSLVVAGSREIRRRDMRPERLQGGQNDIDHA